MTVKILIVDDDQRLSSVYAMALKANGFDVTIAGGGQEGITKVLELKPDLVVLDMMMPAVSGKDVLEAMKGSSETKDIKVVMFSALSDKDLRTKVLTLGADEYIIKSQLTIVQVIDKIKEVLARP